MCTTIFFKNQKGIWVANNEDIFLNTGMLFTNHRQLHKTALIRPPTRPLEWVSIYGSLTFSQVGKEFPSAGMNEAGLVIEQMTLPETVYPTLNGFPAITELQLIQYLLDTCDGVLEALERMTDVYLTQTSGLLHYMLCDAGGNVAVVEYLDGQMVVYRDKDLPICVLANSSYEKSLAHLYQSETNKVVDVDEYNQNSLARFTEAAQWEKETPVDNENLLDYAFQSLDAVARNDTVWRIVYSLKNLNIHFKTQWSPEVKTVNVDSFNFSAENTPLVTNLQQLTLGQAGVPFVEYSIETNRELVYSFFRNPFIVQTFGFEMPDDMLVYFSTYPDQMIPN